MEKEKRGASKGNANRRTLADRMKTYEAVTTGASLVERLPIYARVDMRAGHTWCRGLEKPFDARYASAMKAATAYVVGETGAALGMTQSDEASFVWLDDSKVPFGARLFKLQSVLASMFTAAFMNAACGNGLAEKVSRRLPSFDCRVLNMPSLDEAANMVAWRSMDAYKNSITLVSLTKFSNRQIHGRNGDEKIRMLAEAGVDYRSVPEEYRVGAFFRRETYEKELSPDELAKVPENQRVLCDDGKMRVTRSRVSEFRIGARLTDVANKAGVLFAGEAPVKKEKAV